jgi:hypothetical protein
MPTMAILPSLALLAVLVAGCGDSGDGATVAPTFASLPSPTPIISPCGVSQQPPGATAQSGDLYFLGISVSNLSNPNVGLPSTTPHAPLRVDTPVSNNVFSGQSQQLAHALRVNPQLGDHGSGLLFSVCDASSTASHVIQGVTVRISALVPHTGALSAWKACDTAYTAQQPQAGGGCGGYGGYLYLDETLRVAFGAGVSAGGSADAAQTSSGKAEDGPSQAGPLPVTLAPHQALSFDIGVTAPTTPGAYTFTLGLRADGKAPVWLPAYAPILYAPVSQTYSGAACAAPTMRSQLPAATNPPSYYICPGS